MASFHCACYRDPPSCFMFITDPSLNLVWQGLLYAAEPINCWRKIDRLPSIKLLVGGFNNQPPLKKYASSNWIIIISPNLSGGGKFQETVWVEPAPCSWPSINSHHPKREKNFASKWCFFFRVERTKRVEFKMQTKTWHFMNILFCCLKGILHFFRWLYDDEFLMEL